MTRLVTLVMGAAIAATLASTPAAAQTAAQGTADMRVERVQSGFTVAPVVRAGDIDGETNVLLGGEAGWVFDQTLMLGGAGYGLVTPKDGSRLGYGGGVVEWRLLPAASPIRFGVKALVGGGSATLPADVRILAAHARTDLGRSRVLYNGRQVGTLSELRDLVPLIFPARRVLVRDDFFIVEPAVTVNIRLSRLVEVSAEASYRATAATGLLEDRLNGVAAGLAVRFGGW